MGATPYRGRFAPSPTGPLHAGSLVAALASWLDARAHHGQWLVRIEDLDPPRCQVGAAQIILQQLAHCGLQPDETPLYQSRRGALYQQALDQLRAQGLSYPCGCTRQDIALALAATGSSRERHGELVYPGTCRHGLQGRAPRAWRFNTLEFMQNKPKTSASHTQTAIQKIASQAPHLTWHDRRLGAQTQNLACEVGDFVLQRADGLWAYQLAVVVDDAAQGVSDIVRGEDLADNTARQIALQRALHLPTPRYLHTPLVLGADGDKLSKQNGAQALATHDPLAVLKQAGRVLGLGDSLQAVTPQDWLTQAVAMWASRLKLRGD